MKCVRLQREAGPLGSWKKMLPLLARDPVQSEDPGFFWGRQLMTLHPRGHTSCRTSHRAGATRGVRLNLGKEEQVEGQAAEISCQGCACAGSVCKAVESLSFSVHLYEIRDSPPSSSTDFFLRELLPHSLAIYFRSSP